MHIKARNLQVFYSIFSTWNSAWPQKCSWKLELEKVISTITLSKIEKRDFFKDEDNGYLYVLLRLQSNQLLTSKYLLICVRLISQVENATLKESFLQLSCLLGQLCQVWQGWGQGQSRRSTMNSSWQLRSECNAWTVKLFEWQLLLYNQISFTIAIRVLRLSLSFLLFAIAAILLLTKSKD